MKHIKAFPPKALIMETTKSLLFIIQEAMEKLLLNIFNKLLKPA
jgi:hypothetical protein